MYIEKISDDNKKRYIQAIVDKLNTNPFGFIKDENDDSFLHLKKPDDRDIAYLKSRGFLDKISSLQNENIFFEIYENHSEDFCHRYSHQYAFIVIFSDTSVKFFKANVGCRDYYNTNIENVFEFLAEHKKQIDYTNPLATNSKYIKEFMLPHLNTIDKNNGTNLVGEYKEMLSQKFERKEQLVAQKFQSQKSDLGINK